MNHRDRDHESILRSINHSVNRQDSAIPSINNSPQLEPLNHPHEQSILRSVNRQDSIMSDNLSPHADAEHEPIIDQSVQHLEHLSEEDESLSRQAELRDRSKSFLAPLQIRNTHPFSVNDPDQPMSAPVTSSRYSPHGAVFAGFQFTPTTGTESPRSTTLTSHADMARTPVGNKTLNQYELSGSLGSGRFGNVIKVRDVRDSTIYAMKIISKQGVARSRGLSKSRTAAPTPHGMSSTWSEQMSQCNTPYNNPTEQAWQAIRREVAIMMSLDHPNIVRLIEVIDDARADALYLVMDLASGGPLVKDVQHKHTQAGHQMIARSLTLPVIRTYFRQVFNGLAYLDSVGIVHRDIKPSNLLLSHPADDPNCTVKIADFGMSQSVMNDRIPSGTTPILRTRQIEPAHHHAFSFTQSVNPMFNSTFAQVSVPTSTTQFDLPIMSPSTFEPTDRPTNAGSTAFLSPEQCGLVDPLCKAAHCTHDAVCSDIWSTGISMFLCAFACLPFYSASPHELYQAIVHDAVQFPVCTAEMLEQGTEEEWQDLQSLIIGLLRKRPCERFTFDEIACHPFLTQRGELDELDYQSTQTKPIERSFTVLHRGHTKQKSSVSNRP